MYSLYEKCNKVTIDSRTIENDDIFFAFSGENFNAASLAFKAIENGALAVFIEDESYADPENHIYYVSSTLRCLQELATYHRSLLQIPIIGLTGSNGKTTTKELIYTVLQRKYNVQFTKGNLNNHIGVPLTILSIDKTHEIAVVEMGANHQKEIEELCQIAQPTMGYITNFGKAHLEGFGGIEGVIKGKCELYDFLKSNHNTIIVNSLDPIQVTKTFDYDNIIQFGSHEFKFVEISKDNYVGLEYENISIMSHLTGNYNFTNISAAVRLGLHFKIEIDDIKNAIESYFPSNMRSQIVENDSHILVVDTYNANPSSMSASLLNFSQFEGSKCIIIGDMLELGVEAPNEHMSILNLAQDLDFDQIITVGTLFNNVQSNKLSFLNVDDLMSYLKLNNIAQKNILLKASRGIALEKALEYIK